MVLFISYRLFNFAFGLKSNMNIAKNHEIFKNEFRSCTIVAHTLTPNTKSVFSFSNSAVIFFIEQMSLVDV